MSNCGCPLLGGAAQSMSLISEHWDWAPQVPLGHSTFIAALKETPTTPPVLLAAPQNLSDSLTALILIKKAFGKLLHCH